MARVSVILHLQASIPVGLCSNAINPSRVGDVVNKWRRDRDLEEVDMFDGPTLVQTLKIPFTYCWSQALVPKPVDWPPYIGAVPTTSFFGERTPVNRLQMYVASSSAKLLSTTRRPSYLDFFRPALPQSILALVASFSTTQTR